MAIFLAGMVLLGVQPGPGMADPDGNLHLTYTAVWSLALANVFGTIMCVVLAPWISRITTIRYTIIAPFMILIIAFAAFLSTRSLNDLITLIAVGLLGKFLRRLGWPPGGSLRNRAPGQKRRDEQRQLRCGGQQT